MNQPQNNQRQTGILKANDSTNPQAPTYKGWCTINGQRMWISAWWKPHGTGKLGAALEFTPHFQLVFEEAQDKPQEHIGGTPFSKPGFPQKAYMGVPANMGAHPSTQPQSLANIDDDIPF